MNLLKLLLWILLSALFYAVYLETGPATVALLVIIFISMRFLHWRLTHDTILAVRVAYEKEKKPTKKLARAKCTQCGSIHPEYEFKPNQLCYPLWCNKCGTSIHKPEEEQDNE